jgi:hypothetical protein
MLTTKVWEALLAGLMFFIISNPIVYKLVDGVLGDALGRISSPSGCPTTWGLVVHSAVFAAATYYGIGL